MELDESISMGKGIDEGIQGCVNNLAENYACADNDHQRASTDWALKGLIKGMCGDNKARLEYWTGVYNDKKAELAAGLLGSQSAAE